jgi:DNA-binding MarR family transcriptional regulator
MVDVDRIVMDSMMVHLMRTIEKPAVVSGTGTTYPSAEDALKDRIIANFRETMLALKCIGSERMVKLGVSMTQVHVLSMLQRHGDLPMSRLAELIDVSLSNATGLIDRMEERGYVERVRVPDDRRVVIVRTTEGGRRVMDDMAALHEQTIRTVLDRLAPDQLSGIDQATADLRDAISTEADPTSRLL